MPTYQADVTPDQPWEEDGTADIAPEPPFENLETFSLPLEHRADGPVTVLKFHYPKGLVIIPSDNAPSGGSAVLPMEVSDGNVIEVPNTGHQSWPKGIVVRFID